MSIDTAPDSKRCRTRQLNKGSWTVWPYTHQPDPDRPRRRARRRLLRCSASGRLRPTTGTRPQSRRTSCCPVTPESARRGCWSSCATSRSRRAGAWSPGTAWTSATAHCPTSRSPRCSAGSRPSCRTVVERVAEAHPSLARLQPGRRVMAATDGAADLRPGRGRDARPGRPVRRGALPAGGGCRGVPAAAGHRGLPLGRPVDPRPAQLPVLPSLRGPGGDRGVVPRRRPAPPPPAPSPGRRVVAAERCRAAPARPARRRPGPAAHRQPLAGRDPREGAERDRAPRRGQRVLRRGAGRCGRRARQLGPRRSRRRAAGPPGPAQRRPPGRWSGWPASPAARSRTTCSSRRPGSRPSSSRRGCARPSR